MVPKEIPVSSGSDNWNWRLPEKRQDRVVLQVQNKEIRRPVLWEPRPEALPGVQLIRRQRTLVTERHTGPVIDMPSQMLVGKVRRYGSEQKSARHGAHPFGFRASGCLLASFDAKQIDEVILAGIE